MRGPQAPTAGHRAFGSQQLKANLASQIRTIKSSSAFDSRLESQPGQCSGLAGGHGVMHDSGQQCRAQMHRVSHIGCLGLLYRNCQQSRPANGPRVSVTEIRIQELVRTGFRNKRARSTDLCWGVSLTAQPSTNHRGYADSSSIPRY